MKLKIVLLIVGIALFSPAAGKANPRTGVSDGKLQPCPDSPNCVSSQGIWPAHAIEPLAYDGSWPQAKENLLQTLRSMKRCRIVTEQADYIHAEFTSVIFRFVDDVEFLADDVRKIVHVRSASRVGYSDFGVNRRRVEIIRNLIKARHIPLHETKNP
jgi:uncharacterized protein (DUF1499 family)